MTRGLILLLVTVAAIRFATGQSPASPTAPPTGTILFERTTPADPAAAPSAAMPTLEPGEPDPLHVTDLERSAFTFTAYDLDAQLTPASGGLSLRARLTVRNDSSVPQPHLVLQISSSLRWDAFSLAGTPLAFTPRLVPTDTDHTGYATEAVVTLPEPLAPGASVSLVALYAGTISASAERLERIGAPTPEAVAADWDAIAPSGTALRGFGNVLWYPVASPSLFLGDGAKLFDATGRAKLHEAAASVRLRLMIDYVGDPPDAAFFCGRRELLTAHTDAPDLPVAEAPGVATAVFPPAPLGFRALSLFVTDHPPTQVDAAPNLAGTPDVGLIAAVTDHYDALASYSAAAAMVQPLVADWLGPHPLALLNLLDHPGQPFEDGALLVRPVRTEDPKVLAPALVHSLTHAWFHSTHPWIDEGLAQFLGLLWIERTAGRAVALAQLGDSTRALALLEPSPVTVSGPTSSVSSSSPGRDSGQPLSEASSDVYLRAKAAAVFWQLRDIAGDEAVKQALQTYRLDPAADRDPAGLQHALEQASHKDLRWFFDDWVEHDRGLPDLTILSVTPRPLEASNGRPAGWLVSIDVANEGDAVADVPVTIRGDNSSTQAQRLRVPAHSSASTRIVFSGTPTEVEVNDGSVPETRTSTHTRALAMPALR